MDKPIVLKNFISHEDCLSFIDYIEKNQDWFNKAPNGTSFFSFSAKDPSINFNVDIYDTKYDGLRELLLSYAYKFESTVKEVFSISHPLYLTQFFIKKSVPGCWGKPHIDTEGYGTDHFKFSSIMYLNNMDKGGELWFPELNYTYTPKEGDIVLFESGDKNFKHGVMSHMQNRYVIPMWATDQENYKLINREVHS